MHLARSKALGIGRHGHGQGDLDDSRQELLRSLLTPWGILTSSLGVCSVAASVILFVTCGLERRPSLGSTWGHMRRVICTRARIGWGR